MAKTDRNVRSPLDGILRYILSRIDATTGADDATRENEALLLGCFEWLGPDLPIKAAVLNGFGDVIGADVLRVA